MNKKKGTTKPELEKRVQEAQEYLLTFTPTWQIQEIMMAKYGVKEHAVWRYLSKARQLMTERNQLNIEEKRNQMLNTLENLYNKAYHDKQFATAHKILQEISALQQLYPEAKALTQRDPMIINFAQREQRSEDQNEKT